MTKESKITFELEDKHTIRIIRDGKKIGHFYSGDGRGAMPYPHDDSVYCLNSIQICGFDKISEVWGCGPFHGHKDVVINFIEENDYIKQKTEGYLHYVKQKIAKKEERTIQNFVDWNAHNI